MGDVDIDELLPDPGEIWWPFAVLAAIDRARGRRVWEFDAGNHLLCYDGADGGRIRMQRLYGGRIALWGHAAGERPEPVSWSGIPGWAISDAIRHRLRREGATLLAWYRHGEWDGLTPHADVERVLGPIRSADVPDDLLRRARARTVEEGDLAKVLGDSGDPERGLKVLREATREATPVQVGVRSLLAGEIYAQMRRTPDRDRGQPARPAAVVRWARVVDVPEHFNLTVRAERGQLIPDPESDSLPTRFRTQLLNVLTQLYASEASEDGGAWLFARVVCEGPRVRFDRAYDGMPEWYDDTPLPLDALAWEMSRRRREWRPPWAALLAR